MTSYLPPTNPPQNANNVTTSIQREGKMFVQLWDGDEKVQVNTDGSVNTNITDPVTGKPVNVEQNGGLAVNIQDQHTRAFDLHLSQDVGSSTTLTQNVSADDYTIYCASGHGLADGDHFKMYDSTVQHGHTAEVVSVVGDNQVNMDRPLGFDLTAAGTVVQEITYNMAVDGSVTRQIFSIGSPLTAELDVVRLMFQMTTTDAVTWDGFGDQAALSRGVLFRQVFSDGTGYSHWNVKATSELAHLMYDLAIYDTAHPQAVNGLAGRLTYGSQGKHGVTLRIGPNESLQMIIQDDLEGILSFEVMAQGHIVTD